MKRLVILLMLLFTCVLHAGTYYVDASTSNADVDTVGTVDTSGDPYGLQAAFDNVAAGDTILIKADATYTLTAAIDINTTAGSAAAPINVNGCNTSWVVDGTKPEITSSASIDSGLFSITFAGNTFYWFSFVDFNGGGAGKADNCITGNNNANYVVFRSCIFRSADESNITIMGNNWTIETSEIASATTIGVLLVDTGAAYGSIVRCSIHDNGTDGIESIAGYTYISRCLVYDNGSNGINFSNASSDQFIITNNTVYINDVAGFVINTGADRGIMYDNTSCSNGTHGYVIQSAVDNRFYIFTRNHGNDNTTAVVDFGTWATLFGGTNIIGAPLFTTVTDGSEDFTPAAGSVLLDVDDVFLAGGTNYSAIGAIQPDSTAGGSGGQHSTKQGGKQ